MTSQPGPSKRFDEVKIPSVLLENFNPFEILEPQKATEANVGVLVEINDPSRSDVQETIFYDKKIKPDLVDLLENIYVTPQQVATKNSAYDFLDLDFFEDKPSVNTEPTDIVDKVQNLKLEDENFNKSHYQFCETHMNNLNNAPKVLKPPKIEDKYDEFRKLEWLEEKTLGSEASKHAYEDTTVSNYRKKRNINDDDKKILTTKPHQYSKGTGFNVDNNRQLMDQIIASHMYESAYKLPDTDINNLSKQASDIVDKINIEKAKYINILNTEANNIKTSSWKANNEIKLLETMRKDEKLFMKQRRVVPDEQKIHYTKGADLHEKSVVLPQIMARIKERKKILDERNKFKPRLILDSGKASKLQIENEPELNPVILMEDCNRERLKSLKISQKFQNFVIKGAYI